MVLSASNVVMYVGHHTAWLVSSIKPFIGIRCWCISIQSCQLQQNAHTLMKNGSVFFSQSISILMPIPWRCWFLPSFYLTRAQHFFLNSSHLFHFVNKKPIEGTIASFLWSQSTYHILNIFQLLNAQRFI